MKSIFKYIAASLLFFCLEVNAQEVNKSQEVGKKSAIPSKTSIKGRRELRKDKRIKRHEKHAQKANAENFETKSDKPFHKKGHHKAPKKPKNTEEIRK